MKTKSLVSKWYAEFECPGGDCGLTCCTSDWNITLTDEEIEKYKQLDHPFKEDILAAIDFENKRMKCTNGYCDLLNEEGYCKKVINCGPDVLSTTCSIFPRNIKQFGDIIEIGVEISCPYVAERLFDAEPIEFMVVDSECDNIPVVDYNLYDGLARARSKLITTLQTVNGKYIYGKLFVLIKVLEELGCLLNDSNVNIDTIQAVLDKYCNDESLINLFAQCEEVGKQNETRLLVMHKTLRNLVNTQALENVAYMLDKTYPDLIKSISEWTEKEDLFREDMIKYSEFIRKKYPSLTEQYLVYSLFNDWTLKYDNLTDLIPYRLIELFVIHLYGMAIWKEKSDYGKNAEIYEKNISIAIANIDRRMSHSCDLRKNITTFCENELQYSLIDMMLTIVK